MSGASLLVLGFPQVPLIVLLWMAVVVALAFVAVQLYQVYTTLVKRRRLMSEMPLLLQDEFDVNQETRRLVTRQEDLEQLRDEQPRNSSKKEQITEIDRPANKKLPPVMRKDAASKVSVAKEPAPKAEMPLDAALASTQGTQETQNTSK